MADVAASGRLLGAESEMRFLSFEDGTLGIPPGSFGRGVGMEDRIEVRAAHGHRFSLFLVRACEEGAAYVGGVEVAPRSGSHTILSRATGPD